MERVPIEAALTTSSAPGAEVGRRARQGPTLSQNLVRGMFIQRELVKLPTMALKKQKGVSLSMFIGMKAQRGVPAARSRSFGRTFDGASAMKMFMLGENGTQECIIVVVHYDKS